MSASTSRTGSVRVFRRMRGAHRPCRVGVFAALVVGACGLAGGVASAQPTGVDQPIDVELYRRAAPEPQDLGVHVVSRFVIAYADDGSLAQELGLPSLSELENVEFSLLQTSEGFVAPRPGLPVVTMRIADVNAGPPRKFYGSALLEINRAIVDELNRRYSLYGVFVAPDDVFIPDGGDQRPDQTMTLRISIARVANVRTQASGPRIQEDNRIDHPSHRRIKARSPVQPISEEEGVGRSLLRRDLLDDYAARLNRHPGRRVNASIGPTGIGQGEAVLDFLVYESKPWTLYAQMSNTGTDSTDDWRYRFGFIHNQLTSNDDILTIDYITAGFDASHAVLASYEAPFFNADRLRWRIEGAWNEYEATDVGLTDEGFNGEGYSFAGELIWNVYQDREFFVDLFGGLRWQHVEVENDFTGIKGEEDFFAPYIGARIERIRETDAFDAEISLTGGFGGDEDELEFLGRTNPDDSWVFLGYRMRYSFYLEPLLNFEGWADADTTRDPDTWRDSTLAHEVVLSARGQYALGHRLIPNLQAVVGGAYSVRGYDESVVASDSVYIFSAEYRLHVPRLFRPAPPRDLFGTPFKVAPQQIYGRPDWDLVPSVFTDFAFARVSDREAFESNEELWSIGIGLEAQFRRNIIARLDFGHVLKDAGENESGDNRLHFVLTVMY
ncbi:MAG: ShlB/FhaC/HecB family hemolysin secretion/activation protein [Phycisphaeraceae bacterium]|nr:ShlB/FhaC/HecB family hemolysin secretion/activation protein [Phycisphaeraceae bacterium]MCW5753855.1 ShlB/FhaC/HecB family hemolysin secretion/activation protein [Phycisphaeraceae bacterium]